MAMTFMENVLDNVFKYIEFRGLNPVIIDRKQFINEITAHEYVQLLSGRTLIVITLKGGTYSKIDAQTKALIVALWGSHDVDEMLYICGVTYSNASDMSKLNKILTKEIPNSDVMVRSYNAFMVDISKAKIVPKHEIISKAQFKAIAEFIYTNESEIPKINAYDPAAVWINAKVGDIIRVHRQSPSVLYSSEYRIVI
jgi:DNA-directed RNA polymerase subunit H (RpoH/RPB5)